MWDIQKYQVDESYNESVEENYREKVKKKYNLKKPVWTYARDVNNETNILCETINREVQSKEKKCNHSFNRFRKSI